MLGISAVEDPATASGAVFMVSPVTVAWPKGPATSSGAVFIVSSVSVPGLNISAKNAGTKAPGGVVLSSILPMRNVRYNSQQ